MDPTLLTVVILCFREKRTLFASKVGELLSNLIVTVLEKRSKLLDSKDSSSGEFDIANDRDSSSEEENGVNGDEVAYDPAILLTMSQFLLAKLQDIIASSSQDEFLSLQKSSMSALKVVIECSSGIMPASNRNSAINDFLHLQPSLGMLKIFLSTMSTILQRLDKSTKLFKEILAAVFAMLVRAITHGKKIMVLLLGPRNKNRLGRSECHALVMFRVKYIATVSSELASMLSSNENQYLNDGTIAESFLVKELMRVKRYVIILEFERLFRRTFHFAH
jgi:hypothetical protein